LQAKVEAGAQFVQTQFCMDAGVVHRYMARLAEQGLTDKLSFLIGVVPLRSAKSARWIKEKLFGAVIPDALIDRMEQATDPVAEGTRICADIIRDLSDVTGVAGVHIMAPWERCGCAGPYKGRARRNWAARAGLTVPAAFDGRRTARPNDARITKERTRQTP
jgi:methylenetetrahydrofolate reductase (NADPH)